MTTLRLEDDGTHDRLDDLKTGIAGVTTAVEGITVAFPNTAASAAKQDTGNASLATIAGAVSAGALNVIGTFYPATQPISGAVSVSNFPATQPVSAASLPLPAGAATASAQATLHTDLAQLHTDLAGTLTTGLPSGASTSALQTTGNTKLDTLHADLAALGLQLPAALIDSRLPVIDQGIDTVSAAGSLTALNQFTDLAIPQGMRSALVRLSGTWAGNITFQVSIDGGSTYVGVQAFRYDNLVGPTLTTSGNSVWAIPISPGVTNVRATCTTFTSGTIVVQIWANDIPITAFNPVIGAGSNIIGFTQSAGRWQDETITALAANGTFTGTSFDLTVSSSGVSFGSGSSFAKEVRVSAEADVVGTLYLDASRDGTTWRRIKKVTLAQADAACVFYGEIIHEPSWRYTRLGFVNGATLQAHFTAQSLRIG